MRLWQRVKGFFRLVQRSWKGQGFDFTKWFSPRNIFAREAGNTLATNETIFAAISRLSNSMASLPLKLNREFEQVNSRVADLLANSPNPNMTSFDFIRTLEVHRDVHGNGYALKMYDSDYQVESIWILDPSKVTPVIEESSDELWYEVEGKNGRYYVHNLDMIHVKHIHTVGYQGIKPIAVLRNTIDFDVEVRKFSRDQMDGAIKASFLLEMATHLGDEEKKKVLDSFRNFYQENGGVLIQEAGVKITPLERKFIDT